MQYISIYNIVYAWFVVILTLNIKVKRVICSTKFEARYDKNGYNDLSRFLCVQYNGDPPFQQACCRTPSLTTYPWRCIGQLDKIVKTPLRFHRTNRLYSVLHGQYSRGTSFHCKRCLMTYRMLLITMLTHNISLGRY